MEWMKHMFCDTIKDLKSNHSTENKIGNLIGENQIYRIYYGLGKPDLPDELIYYSSGIFSKRGYYESDVALKKRIVNTERAKRD